ncbi:MAG TPA: FAD-binding protein, partial [Planctomycetia bacterium]|nr:FAD-binding protein [Planctomycetia bacterium]
LVPVTPAEHYLCGGVATDRWGATSVPGLYAVGEVAATGVHGANRLASNSLLEALVFGYRCGAGAGTALAEGMLPAVAPLAHTVAQDSSPDLDLADIRNSLCSLMFRDVGIEREREGLQAAAEQVDFWCRYALAREFHDPAGWELQNLLTVAGLVARAALARTESRGTHFRLDHPATDDAGWRRRLLLDRAAAQAVKGPMLP